MINYQKLEGPYGIPVYFQQLPPMVGSVALSWVVFTGSCDDHDVGADGIYHWFEHVPFRGTKRFPNGYKDTLGRFIRYGGEINAWTNFLNTCYKSHVPKKVWSESLDLITDLVSQPILSEESILAEKQIIAQEITGRRSTAKGNAYYELPAILWPNHRLGHSVLGTEKSINSVEPSVLVKAHQDGYDRSRCVLFAIGDITKEELLTEVAKYAERIPNNSLSERRSPVSWGELPQFTPGVRLVKQTQFTSSVVMMFFPVPPNAYRKEVSLHYDFLSDMYSLGGPSAPLGRIVREERNLVYGVNTSFMSFPDGGRLGFIAEAKRENIESIISAFIDVLKDKSLRSKERFEEVKEARFSIPEMRDIAPDYFNHDAIGRLLLFDEVISDQELNDKVDCFSHDHIVSSLDSLNPEDAHIIVFEGLGKS